VSDVVDKTVQHSVTSPSHCAQRRVSVIN